MPTYTMKNKETGEIKDMFLSISKMEELKEEGEWEQIIGSPKIVSGVGGHGAAISKAGTGWKDLLGRVKKGSGRGNTIKT
jgi:hypothetical protein